MFNKERILFERAIESPFVPSEEELDNAYALHEKDYAFINKKKYKKCCGR